MHSFLIKLRKLLRLKEANICAVFFVNFFSKKLISLHLPFLLKGKDLLKVLHFFLLYIKLLPSEYKINTKYNYWYIYNIFIFFIGTTDTFRLV